MTSQTVGLRIDAETQTRLKKLAKARDRSPHYLMKQAVERYLSCEEAVEAEDQLLDERWQEFLVTGKSYSHEDVKTWAVEMVRSRQAK